jgi:uncharacterized membrane protein YdjX (TVP38/TMEM64 family)
MQGGAGKVSEKRGIPIKPVILVVAIIALVVMSKYLGLGGRVEELRGWIEGLGALGPVVYVLIYIVGVVAFLPGSVITVLAGALFGSVVGIAVVSAGSTIGAGLCFLISRYLARETVAGWLGSSEQLKKLDDMSGKHGAAIVALTRLVPIFPFNVLNYGFGLTRVGFWTYLFWSWLCMIPGTILYVVGADTLTKALETGEVPWGLVLALAAAIIAVTFIVRFARKRLKEAEDTDISRETSIGE